MDKLFSPWRSKYIQTFSGPTDDRSGCILCKAHEDNKDDDHLIVTRGDGCFVIMNLFPYNSGHLMVVPYRHVSNFTDLSDDESLEVMRLLRRMMVALQQVSHPDGFNIGSNIGRTAGAGIDQHVHFHIVPRWNGDTNFMAVIDDVKIVNEALGQTAEKLKQAFAAT